jgi:hypothetical protein
MRYHPSPIPPQGAMRWAMLLVASLAVLPAVGLAALALLTAV